MPDTGGGDPPGPGLARFAVGVGLSSRAEPAEVAALVAAALDEGDVPAAQVASVATVDTRASHPALAPLAWPVVAFTRADLATATPDGGATAHPGAVAEPAALLAAGEGAVLVVPKRRSAHATVAVARSGAGVSRRRPWDRGIRMCRSGRAGARRRRSAAERGRPGSRA